MGTTHLDALQVAGVPTMGVNPLPLANNYWFVSSLVGSNSFPGNSYGSPFGTLAYAAAYSGLAAGDCIVVMEGHAETIAAAGGVTLSTAGVYVVGLGSGAYRPTFTFSTSTAATFLISGASVSVSNIVGVTGVDQVVSPFSITGASCSLGTQQYGYVEWQDPSSALQAIRPVLTSATADNLIVNLKVIGITSGGTSPVNGVRLVGCNSGLINIDFYGRASTSVVEFQGTLCTNVEIYGYMYNSGVTNYTKDVVDTATSSTWFASFYDGAAGYAISGGSGSALGPAAAATVIADLGVATVDGTANALERDVIGNKTDAGVQTVGTTNSLAGYTKGILDQLSGAAGITTFPAAAAAANAVSLAEVIRYISELQVQRIASKAIANAAVTLTTGASPVTLFTVTGDVIARVWATVQTGLTSTATTGTLEIGVSGNTAGILPQVVANGTNFPTGAVWAGDTSPTLKAEVFSSVALNGCPIAGSANIICTVATNSMTAGAITFYCQYLPVSSGASVVAA